MDKEKEKDDGKEKDENKDQDDKKEQDDDKKDKTKDESSEDQNKDQEDKKGHDTKDGDKTKDDSKEDDKNTDLHNQDETKTQAVRTSPIVRLGRTPSGPPLDLICARTPENPLVVAVAACTGCLNACTYCKTRAARGRLRSQPAEAVVACVVACVRAGAREVRLTGEDVGAYGLDIGTTLASLVAALADALARTGTGAMLRVGMANPPYILRDAPRLAALLRHPNVHSYLHVPVQSGSDAVLAAMRRDYTVADFDRCVAALRAALPDVTLVTDVIVGFPGEREDDHLATLALLQRHRFPFVNINAMFVRPGTPAARMSPVPPQTLRRRVREVSAFFASCTSPFDHLVGRTVPVSVCERAHRPGQWAAHTKEYVQVLLDDAAFAFPDPALLASGKPFQRMNVRITGAGKWSVTGVPC